MGHKFKSKHRKYRNWSEADKFNFAFSISKGKRKRSWDKVADLIYKEGFRNTKGKRIGRSYIIQVLSRIKTGRLDVKKNYKLPNETLNRRSEYFNKYDKENIK